MKISLWRRHALTVTDCAFSHKIDYVTIFKEILNPKGHPNCITGSKVTAILLNGWILSFSGASSGRVCSCSLRIRLVWKAIAKVPKKYLYLFIDAFATQPVYNTQEGILSASTQIRFVAVQIWWLESSRCGGCNPADVMAVTQKM